MRQACGTAAPRAASTYVSAMTVANSILSLASRNGVPVNPMKLQRLLYLAYCGYAKSTGNRLFHERFAKWAFGPVCESVYWKFQCFRDKPIACLAKDAKGVASVLDTTGCPAMRHVLADIEDVYLRMSARTLCDVVRADGTAWDKAFRTGKDYLDDADIAIDPCYSA